MKDPGMGRMGPTGAARSGGGVLLAALLAVGCGGESDDGPRLAGPGGPGGLFDRGIPVAAEVATPGALEVTLRASANLRAREEVEVLPMQQGVLSRVLVEEGDAVRRGQVMAELQDEEWRLQARQAEARALRAREAVERARILQGQGLFSDAEVDNLASDASVAEAELELAQLRVRNARVVAPMDGIVTHRYVERGELVSLSTPLFGVADMSALEARVGIPERQADRVREGQLVRIQADEASGPPATGRVVRIRPVVDPGSGTVQVTVELDPREAGNLRPGRFVNVDIVTEVLPERITVPRTAVLVDGALPRIYVIQGGRAVEREVETGFARGDRVEIRSGLDPSDTVVVVGQDNLRPDAPVRLMELDGVPVTAPEADPELAERPGEASVVPTGGAAQGALP